METIQIEVSSNLARRLQPYQNKLPRLLEWGLRVVEKETKARSDADLELEMMAVQERTITTLREAGAIGADPEIISQYLAAGDTRAWQPIAAGGKPASEMIVEERDSRGWIGR
ncbi:MAG: hypothetical protein AUK03_01170 [Anaerolineae bacterium CG2_30_64_16]|nr:MAG: hypothetical protein AUK03_01170 [Anaerolineae bacterium CG2_30_64_16]